MSLHGAGVTAELQRADALLGRLDDAVDRAEILPAQRLGLAICRQIAKLHGGSISVKSEPGKGSDFIVKLPVYQKLL